MKERELLLNYEYKVSSVRLICTPIFLIFIDLFFLQPQTKPVFSVLGIIYLVYAITIYIYLRTQRFKFSIVSPILYSSHFVDVTGVAVLIYFTGGLSSPMFILYFILMSRTPILIIPDGKLFQKFISITGMISWLISLFLYYGNLIKIFTYPHFYLLFLTLLFNGIFLKIRNELYRDIWHKIRTTLEQLQIETEQRQKIQSFVEKQKVQLETLVENINDGILLLNRQKEVILVNLEFTRILNFPRSHLINHTLPETNIFMQINNLVDNIFTGKKDKEQIELQYENENQVQTLRIQTVPIYGKKKPVTTISTTDTDKFNSDEISNQITGCLVMLRDTSRDREFQKQLVQTAKLVTLGELAGGIAHEINNPTTVVLGCAQLLLTEISKNSPYYKDIYEIEKAAQRIKYVTSQLLNFLHPTEQFQMVDINQILKTSVDLFSRGSDLKQMRIRMQLDDNMLSVMGIPIEIEQVFINLFINARDAMPSGGTLTVSSSYAPADENIKVSFTDTGIGISDEIKQRIFDPFFTTKPFGKGTGLGLSVSQRIILKHKGKIEVESTLGKGTTITIYLPINTSTKTNE